MKSKTPFSKLSKSEKRIVILKDALKHLRAERIHADGGFVMRVDDTNYTELQSCDLQSLIKARKCTVCQRGALLFAMVYRSDNFIVDLTKTKLGSNGSFGGYHGDDKLIDPFLEKLFSVDQLKLMETAFEGSYWHFGLGSSDSARAFGGRFHNNQDRMEAILKNAIKNKGIFKP
jgi:hypothetical protein